MRPRFGEWEPPEHCFGSGVGVRDWPFSSSGAVWEGGHPRMAAEASGAGEATPIGRVVVSQAAKLCGAALAALKCEQSSRARVGALNVLRALVECDGVPWSTLFPLRPRVCTALGVALDDDRRSVRQAAVAAKDSWEANR